MLQNEAGKQVFGAAESVGRSLFSFACLAVSGQKEGAGAAQGLLSPAGSRNEQTSLPLAEKGGGGLSPLYLPCPSLLMCGWSSLCLNLHFLPLYIYSVTFPAAQH